MDQLRSQGYARPEPGRPSDVCVGLGRTGVNGMQLQTLYATLGLVGETPAFVVVSW